MVEKAEGQSAHNSSSFLQVLALIERLHRLQLDMLKDEFERIGGIDVNPVQALILYNIGTEELTAGDLRARGHYQGSNVSYNLRKLVTLGHMEQRRSTVDRRALYVRASQSGLAIARSVSDLFDRHGLSLDNRGIVTKAEQDQLADLLLRMERYWKEQIRYIY